MRVQGCALLYQREKGLPREGHAGSRRRHLGRRRIRVSHDIIEFRGFIWGPQDAASKTIRDYTLRMAPCGKRQSLLLKSCSQILMPLLPTRLLRACPVAASY